MDQFTNKIPIYPRRVICIFLVFLKTSVNLFSQIGWTDKGILYQNGNVIIRLKINSPIDPCVSGKQYKYGIVNENVSSNVSKIPKYCIWKMDILNCDEDIITKSFSIDISKSSTDGFNADLDWIFNAKEILGQAYESSMNNISSKVKDVVKPKQQLKAPESISAVGAIVLGTEVSLYLNGGELGKSGKYIWYSGGCGIQQIGTGSSIRVSPTNTTTYYVRAEDNQSKTACISTRVVVDNDSKPADKIIGNNKICGENVLPIKLEIVGGRLGYKAKWIWYKNTIESSNKIGEGRELVINQPTPGNILVRAEGVSNNTSTSSIQIDLLENSVRPDNLNISKEIICEGEQIILKILGGKLANDAKWVIYKSDINPINKLTSGVENEFRILPNISINYVVRAEGFCNVTATVSTKIMVLKQSSRPVTINYIKKDGSENSFQLKTVGGLLGDQAKWVWYKGECNEKKIGTGEVISYNLKHNDKISVRAEGFCNTTECIFIQPAIKNNQDWYIPNFINAGIVTSDFKNTPNTFFAFGSKKYYLKIKTSLGFLYPDRPILTDYLSDNIKILNYKPRNSGYTYLFNGSIVAERESYCIGYISRIFNIKLFVGGGYGKYNLFWGIDEYYSNTIEPINVFEWAKNLNSSYSGFEIETGLMVNINKINIMTGFNSILSSKRVPFIDFSLGIGYSF